MVDVGIMERSKNLVHVLTNDKGSPLKFHIKFWTNAPQNMHFTGFFFCVWVMISLIVTSYTLVRRAPGRLQITYGGAP